MNIKNLKKDNLLRPLIKLRGLYIYRTFSIQRRFFFMSKNKEVTAFEVSISKMEIDEENNKGL